MTRSAAFNRTLLLSPLMLRQSLPVLGDVGAFATKLASGRPVTISAIGSSNVVRGGCHEWQNAKCSRDARYTARATDDYTYRGWLLQAFDAMNRTWPHGKHRLVNAGRMASSPGWYAGCSDKFVPRESDLVIIGFSDVCFNWQQASYSDDRFMRSFEDIIRTLSTRRPIPTILLFNFFKFVNWKCTLGGGLCRFWETCEAKLEELAHYYGASVVTTRNAFYHMRRTDRMHFTRWTQDRGGHFDLSTGDKYAAEMVYNFMVQATLEPTSTQTDIRGDRLPPAALYDRHDCSESACAAAVYSCYDFEEADRLPLLVTNVSGWSWEEYETSRHSGERKPKPGYVSPATANSTLVLHSRMRGAAFLSISYTRGTAFGNAHLSCVPPCACKPTVIGSEVHARDSTQTLVQSPLHALVGPDAHDCLVILRVHEGDAFKLNGFRTAPSEARDTPMEEVLLRPPAVNVHTTEAPATIPYKV